MLILANTELTVELLDPVADRDRLGARYCAGGYIFQVTDRTHGTLLTGPTYPNTFNTFDGQGMPDAFNLSPLRSVGDTSTALIIGVGKARLDANYQKNECLEPCSWRISRGAGALTFETEQSHDRWSLALARKVSLAARTIRSETTVVNRGSEAIPLRWFPHPFFPQTTTDELIKLNIGASVHANMSYELLPNGWIARKDWPWTTGHYLALDHDAHTPLVIQQRHPKLGIVTATTSYVPDFFPIWGNPLTFSWEPFLERAIAPGQSYNWWIDYDF